MLSLSLETRLQMALCVYSHGVWVYERDVVCAQSTVRQRKKPP